MSDSSIEVDSLSKTYRRGLIRPRRFNALNKVSFSVPRGRIFGLLGPNGAGKTTFIKILLGIVRRTQGTAQMLGFPAGHRSSRRQVGYLPENLRIPRHHTARSALDYYGSLSGMPRRLIQQRRTELLEAVGLEKWMNEPVKSFSKGMLQRLGLAQAMLHDPDLFILDEPTDGLDPVGRRTVRDILLQLKQQGKTVFLNSHLLQEVETVCDEVAILDHGKLRYVGSIDEITRQSEVNELEFELAAPESEVRAALDQYPDAAIAQQSGNCFQVTIKLPDQSALDDCVDGLRQHGVSIAAMTRRRATLEDAFLQMINLPHDTDSPS
jgi:ABC-2 type transport system ATP-binding protein